MVFSSLTFLFAYLPIVLAIYFIVPMRYRNFVLLLVSLFFYGWGEPIYVLMMVFSIVVNWIFGNYIGKYRKNDKSQAKKYLIYCVVFNLLLLGFFKYYDFFASNLNAIGISFVKPLGLGLPIGISFYTFQAMSYPIDIYRFDTDPQKSVIYFGAYVTMFPQLIAGPIVRYKDIAKELKSRTIDAPLFYAGIERFMIGLCKKVLLANNCGQIWEMVTALSDARNSILTAWLGIICYAFQIYFDFSGYSDMAIGLGKMLGFTFLENFNYPYIAKSITDFWRRWHMSLSYWFRDYVYIPLGGNRKGFTRQICNIMIVWLLTGFWHGASWNFLFWGVFYGVVLIIEKQFLLSRLEKAPTWISHVYTLLIVLLAWVLFAFTDFSKGLHYLGLMFGSSKIFANDITLYIIRNNFVLLVVSVLACTPIAKSKYNIFNKKEFKVVHPLLILLALIICTAFIVDASYNPFLYFRF